MADASNSPITGVDTHAHIFRSDLPMEENRRYAPNYNALCESFLNNLDQHNISHGVLVQPSFLGTNNDFLITSLKEHASLLKGIAVVDKSISDEKLDELNAAGVVGIRLNLIKKPLEDYANAEWQSFFSKLVKRNWVVEIQREIDDLAEFLPAILASGVEVIVDHFARTNRTISLENPQHKAFLDLLKKEAIWIKISAPYRCNASLAEAKVMLDTLRDAYGHSERLLWGSDWPHTQFEHQTDYTMQHDILMALLPDEEERNKVLIHNPVKRFGFNCCNIK